MMSGKIAERRVPCEHPGLWIRRRYRTDGAGAEAILSTTVYIEYADGSGRKKREKIGPDSPQVRKTARTLLTLRKAAILEGRLPAAPASSKMKFKDALDLYWDRHARHLRGTSHRYMKERIAAKLGARRLAEASTAVLQDFLNEVLVATSPSNYNRFRAFLHALFERLKDWGEFRLENPVDRVPKKREPNHRTRYLSKDEMKGLLDACSERLRPVVVCAIATGMRKGEILGLTWDRVDLKTATISILESKDGKRREVAVAPTLLSLLEKLEPREAGSVFGVTDEQAWKDWKAAKKAAQLRDFQFRDLRHTCASWAVMSGVDLYTVQKMLGHSKYEMTQRYAHLSSSHVTAGVAILDSALAETLKKTPLPMAQQVFLRPGKISQSCYNP